MLSDRLKIAMDAAGLSQADLARACKVKPPSVSGWLSGKSKFLRGENLLAAAKALGVSEPWLASGTGPMKIDQPEEKSNVRRLNGTLGEVPKISWVRAGALCDVDDPFEPGDAKDWLICPVKHGPRTFALQVDGDSMDSGDRDGYPDGYDIFVDPDIEPRHGDDVVVRTPNGTSTFKRLQINADGKYLLALNPQWPDRIIKVPEGTIICGVVIYSGKPRR